LPQTRHQWALAASVAVYRDADNFAGNNPFHSLGPRYYARCEARQNLDEFRGVAADDAEIL